MSKNFTPRLTRPTAGNKYYITKGRGGYSDAIQGKPTDAACDVLSNCVGYAYGRFNEIGGYGCCKYLRPVNAENFIQYAGGLTVGQTPRLGACMVWRKGATLSNSDGAGHVAIVEQVLSDTQVVTSESGYGMSTPFYTKTRNKGSGNWGAGSAYTFLGFIYNPAVDSDAAADSGTATASGGLLRRGSTGEAVRSLQEALIQLGYDCGPLGADGDFGAKTEAAVRKFQQDNGLAADGIAGPLTLAKIEELGKAQTGSSQRIQVTASALNVRSGAGTENAVVGVLPQGAVRTIQEERSGWGRILAPAGWISLQYTERLG